MDFSQVPNVGSEPQGYWDDEKSQRFNEVDYLSAGYSALNETEESNKNLTCNNKDLQEYKFEIEATPQEKEETQEAKGKTQEDSEIFYLKKKVEHLSAVVQHFRKRNQVLETVVEKIPNGYNIFKQMMTETSTNEEHRYCCECDNERLQVVIKEQEKAISALMGRSPSPILGSNPRKRTHHYHTCKDEKILKL